MSKANQIEARALAEMKGEHFTMETAHPLLFKVAESLLVSSKQGLTL